MPRAFSGRSLIVASAVLEVAHVQTVSPFGLTFQIVVVCRSATLSAHNSACSLS